MCLPFPQWYGTSVLCSQKNANFSPSVCVYILHLKWVIFSTVGAYNLLWNISHSTPNYRIICKPLESKYYLLFPSLSVDAYVRAWVFGNCLVCEAGPWLCTLAWDSCTSQTSAASAVTSFLTELQLALSSTACPFSEPAAWARDLWSSHLV